MHENRPQVYAPYIQPFSPEKVRDPVRWPWSKPRELPWLLSISRGPSEVGYDVSLADDVTLIQGYAVLAVTREFLGMPLHLSADLVGKSTWARLGISLNTTKVDPGFNGPVTIEITYNPRWTGLWDHLRSIFWPRRVTLPKGVGIGTLVFTNLAHAVRYDGKYGGRGEGPQEAR